MKLTKQYYNETTVEHRNFWVKHFQEFQISGLSRSEYARRNNLVSSQFSYWYYKLKKEPNQIEGGSPDQSSFVAIKIVPDRAIPADSTPDVLCTLELDGNKRLYLHTAAAIENVIKLLAK